MTEPAHPDRQFDAVLFDKDGTLFDFAATWATWTRLLLLRLVDQDLDRATWIGDRIGFDLATNRFARDCVVIAGTTGEVAETLVPLLPAWDRDALVAILDEEAENVPLAETVPLAPFLDRLRAAGYRLGVATNDSHAPALAHLGAARVADRFDFIAGYDSGHGGKPAPGQLLAFCAAVGVVPVRVVMVGDSTHDLIAGRAAGMATVGVLTGPTPADELRPYADVVLPDIGHLPGWLGL